MSGKPIDAPPMPIHLLGKCPTHAWAAGFDAAVSALTAAQQPDHIVDATKMVAQQQDESERMADAWGEFESEMLTDGNGYSPADTYAACHAAFEAKWPDVKAAHAAATAEFRRLHPDTAAQQQGQAVYQVRMFGPFNAWIPVSKGEYDKAEGDKQIVYTAAPPSAPVGVDGTWLWCKLMDWCKEQRLAPATQDKLFAIAGEAHKLNKLAQQPAAVDEAMPEGWRVMPFTGSWQACDERWEVYSPDGSGGVVLASEVRSRDVAELLDALATQHQEPTK